MLKDWWKIFDKDALRCTCCCGNTVNRITSSECPWMVLQQWEYAKWDNDFYYLENTGAFGSGVNGSGRDMKHLKRPLPMLLGSCVSLIAVHLWQIIGSILLKMFVVRLQRLFKVSWLEPLITKCRIHSTMDWLHHFSQICLSSPPLMLTKL